MAIVHGRHRVPWLRTAARRVSPVAAALTLGAFVQWPAPHWNPWPPVVLYGAVGVALVLRRQLQRTTHRWAASDTWFTTRHAASGGPLISLLNGHVHPP